MFTSNIIFEIVQTNIFGQHSNCVLFYCNEEEKNQKNLTLSIFLTVCSNLMRIFHLPVKSPKVES